MEENKVYRHRMTTRIDVLDKGFVELQDWMGDDNAIVSAARVSYLGESKGEEQDKKLTKYLMEHKHTTPFEMVELKFKIKCPLFIARQWMRHRTFSYNEVSRRYTSEEIDFYIPDEIRAQHKDSKQCSSEYGLDVDIQNSIISLIKDDTDILYAHYLNLIEYGVAREQARMILPQNMYTTFICKGNLHNFLHFVSLRADIHAQKEMREYANAIFEYIKEKTPTAAEYAVSLGIVK